jgi:hypothetical protein
MTASAEVIRSIHGGSMGLSKIEQYLSNFRDQIRSLLTPTSIF